METIVLIASIKSNNTCKVFRPIPRIHYGHNKNVFYVFLHPLIFREDKKHNSSERKCLFTIMKE